MRNPITSIRSLQCLKRSKRHESFVYQLAETNKELESENATQNIIAADSNDRGRALLRDDTVRTSKRHSSKTRKSDTTNGPQQQGQVMLYQATVAASSPKVQAPNVPKPIDYSLGPGSVLFPVYSCSALFLLTNASDSMFNQIYGCGHLLVSLLVLEDLKSGFVLILSVDLHEMLCLIFG